MNLVEYIVHLRDAVVAIETGPAVLLEDKGHLDHPEDLVFLGGSSGANRALQSTIDTVNNPDKITIKWDGYPALIFGRDDAGRFSIMDKHMFNKKDGTGRQVYSPAEFRKYDLDRGVVRTELHRLIDIIWDGLEKSDNSKGYYWGDLLFGEPLRAGSDGLYRFRANPKGLTYTVDPDSDIGKELSDKTAGIVVHQYIPADSPTTDNAIPLNGTIGKLKNNSDVAIIPAKMPITPKLNLDNKLVQNVKRMIGAYANDVDTLFDTAPQARNTFNQLFTTYINKKIMQGDLTELLPNFIEYVKTRPMTERMREKIEKHLEENHNGLVGAFQIWAAIYVLKMSVVRQLNKAAETAPVQGYLEDGTITQEGFVSHGLKFVDRMGFSRQNLLGR